MKAPDMAETALRIVKTSDGYPFTGEAAGAVQAILASYTEEVVKALAQESGWPFSVEAAARKLRLIK